MNHIIKPLLRHRLMPLLVIVQVAIACAIACNALFLLQQKLVPIMAPDGIGQPSHLIMVSRIVSRGTPWTASRLRASEAALRAIPGVASVSVAGSLPMVTNARFNGSVFGVGSATRAETAMYIGDHLVDTLGLTLVAGRNFTAAEDAVNYTKLGMERSGPVIVTRALADQLFPDGKALGRQIKVGKDADASQRTVVGVIAHLMRNDFGRGKRNNLDFTMLYPSIPNHWPVPAMAVRVGQADPLKVMAAVKKVIGDTLGTDLAQGIKPSYQMYSALRDQSLAASRAAVWLLGGVCLIVLIVALVGIMGLTGYWVAQRTRQIGVRRALGARRLDILRDVQLENLLIVGVGIVLGMALAYGINLWLMQHYELARLPWSWLPAGAALMLVLGQVAVLVPARRAAAVAPVVATRSV